MIDPLIQDPHDTTEEAQAATKAAVFVAAFSKSINSHRK